MPRFRGEIGTSAAWFLRRARSIVQAGKLPGDGVAGELLRRVLRVEYAKRDEMRMLADIEPALYSGGNNDQVVLLAQHRVHVILDMQIEQATTGDEETHLVLSVAMFFAAFGAQLSGVRLRVIQAYDLDMS